MSGHLKAFGLNNRHTPAERAASWNVLGNRQVRRTSFDRTRAPHHQNVRWRGEAHQADLKRRNYLGRRQAAAYIVRFPIRRPLNVVIVANWSAVRLNTTLWLF